MSSRKERNAESAKRSRDRSKGSARDVMVGVGRALARVEALGVPLDAHIDRLPPDELRQLLRAALGTLGMVRDELKPLYLAPVAARAPATRVQVQVITLADLDDMPLF